MKVKRYEIYADLLNLFMIVLFFATLSWYLQGYLFLPMTPWMPILFGIVLTGAYLARKYIHKLYVYCIAHAALLAFLVLVPLCTSDRVFTLFFAVLWTILDFVYWAERDQGSINMLPVWLVLLFPYLYVRAAFHQIAFMEIEAYVGGIVFMGLFFLRLYCLNIKKFSSDKQMHEQVPVAMMLAQNGKMIVVLVGCFVIGMLLLRSQLLLDRIQEFFLLLREALLRFLRWLMSFLTQDMPETVGGESLEVQAQMQLPPMTETDSFWNRLFYVMEVVVKWTIIFGLVYWAGRGIWQFCVRYRRHDLRREEEICYDGIRETKTWLARNRERRKPEFLQNLTNGEKIRRIYRRRIEKLARSGYAFSKAQTPHERAEDIKRWRETEAVPEPLTELYETARYSTHDISTEDVRKVK